MFDLYSNRIHIKIKAFIESNRKLKFSDFDDKMQNLYEIIASDKISDVRNDFHKQCILK